MAREFIAKLSPFRAISSDEAAQLNQTFHRVRRVQKGATLLSEGKSQDYLYIVKSGWHYAYTVLTDGSRQIHQIFTAGDVIGMENLYWQNATSSVAAITDGEIYTAPVARVRDLFHHNRNLDHLFQSVQMARTAMLIDRLTAISRLGAYNRIAYFLSDALSRQTFPSETPTNMLHMPLSQTFIADCLGLSSVHVSRQFGKLMSEKLIRKIGHKNIEILDKTRLQSIGAFVDRFESLGLSTPITADIGLKTGSIITGANDHTSNGIERTS